MSTTYFFEDIKQVPTLHLKKMLNSYDTSPRTKKEIKDELDRRDSY